MLHASAAFPSHWVLILEAAIVIAGLVLAATGNAPLARAGRAAHHALFVMARRPALSIAAIALASALYLGIHTAVSGPPQPRAVDEWSYLLAADTFAHNRLTNPPHPMAAHFDGAHVLQRPTYASKYPPTQGFALAIGQVAFGHPVAGLWLQAALLVTAVGWMLLAWVPRPWAILGALLVALRLGAGSYWNESYWGGSVAAIGGALLLGAARRLWRRIRVVDAGLLALGLAILAGSRPYEGLLMALPVAVLLLIGIAKKRLRPAPWSRLVLPVMLVVGATLGATALHNQSVTGDPLEFPHRLYDRMHAIRLFLWEPLSDRVTMGVTPPSTFHLGTPESSGWHRLAVALYLFLGLPGIVALIATRGAFRNRWSLFAGAAFLVVAAGHFLIFPWWPHYSAPALAALLVPALQGHRWIYAAPRGVRQGALSDSSRGRSKLRDSRARTLGPSLFAVAIATQIATFVFQIPSQRADSSDPSRQRARLAWEFEHRVGKHLLLLTYPVGLSGDWTFNPADIDAAKVVWATDLGDGRNADLLRYYGDRTVWGIDVDLTATEPVPRLIRPAQPSRSARRRSVPRRSRGPVPRAPILLGEGPQPDVERRAIEVRRPHHRTHHLRQPLAFAPGERLSEAGALLRDRVEQGSLIGDRQPRVARQELQQVGGVASGVDPAIGVVVASRVALSSRVLERGRQQAVEVALIEEGRVVVERGEHRQVECAEGTA